MQESTGSDGAVYVQTNDAEQNEVVAFKRAGDGRLEPAGRVETGGRGNGKAHLPSQGSIVLTADGGHLLGGERTNFGDGTISSYAVSPDGRLELIQPVAASTVAGQKGVRDEALTGDGRYLYALDADARKVFGWSIGGDGSLSPLGAVDGLPATAAGLAAR